MGRSIDEVIAGWPVARRKQLETRLATLVAEELSLQALRKARRKTQVAMAKELRVSQNAVSKVERNADLYISKLRRFVGTLGGELDLTVRFKDRPPVRLTGLGEVEGKPAAKKSKKRTAA
jgi:transcriptional regulator with XRE-family HTH domain